MLSPIIPPLLFPVLSFLSCTSSSLTSFISLCPLFHLFLHAFHVTGPRPLFSVSNDFLRHRFFLSVVYIPVFSPFLSYFSDIVFVLWHLLCFLNFSLEYWFSFLVLLFHLFCPPYCLLSCTSSSSLFFVSFCPFLLLFLPAFHVTGSLFSSSPLLCLMIFFKVSVLLVCYLYSSFLSFPLILFEHRIFMAFALFSLPFWSVGSPF